MEMAKDKFYSACTWNLLKSGMLPGPLVLMVQLTGTSFKRLTSRILPGLPGFETSRKRPQRPQPRWKHHANHVVTVATNGKTWHHWLVHLRYVTICYDMLRLYAHWMDGSVCTVRWWPTSCSLLLEIQVRIVIAALHKVEELETDM